MQHLSLNPEAICWADICKLDVESRPTTVEISKSNKKSQKKKAVGKGNGRRRQEKEDEEEAAEHEQQEEEEAGQEEEEERQEEVGSEAVPESSALEDIKKEVLKLKAAVNKRDKKIKKALKISRSTINQGLQDLLIKVGTLLKNANGAATQNTEEVGETSTQNTEEYYNYGHEGDVQGGFEIRMRDTCQGEDNEIEEIEEEGEEEEGGEEEGGEDIGIKEEIEEEGEEEIGIEEEGEDDIVFEEEGEEKSETADASEPEEEVDETNVLALVVYQPCKSQKSYYSY